MSLPRIYIETTIPSYVTARPSHHAVIAGHQETTRQWWRICRDRFELHVSQFVLDEAGSGDPEAAGLRMEVLHGLPNLPATENALELARALIDRGAVPKKAQTDAAHIAVAAVHGMDFLVKVELPTHCQRGNTIAHSRSMRFGRLAIPNYCTPEQLMREEQESYIP